MIFPQLKKWRAMDEKDRAAIPDDMLEQRDKQEKVTLNSIRQWESEMTKEPEDKIQRDFDKLIADRPELYFDFAQHAFALMRKGFRNYSAKGILEVMRWEADVSEGPQNRLKLNNNYSSRFARLFEDRNPQCAGFFRKRKLHSISANSTHRADAAFQEGPQT